MHGQQNIEKKKRVYMYLDYKTLMKENVMHLYCNKSSSFAIYVVVYVRLQLTSFPRPEMKDVFACNVCSNGVADAQRYGSHVAL